MSDSGPGPYCSDGNHCSQQERIAELEAENARLREALDEINAYTEPLLGHSAHEMRDIAGAALKQEAGDE